MSSSEQPTTDASTDGQSEYDRDQENSSPPGAGRKDGSGHTDGRDEPYDEEPEQEPE